MNSDRTAAGVRTTCALAAVRRVVAAAAIVGLLGTLAGCGDGRLDVVPASGKVLLDGQPLTTGAIFVIPEQGRAASGTIGPDGRFTLTTYEEGDGCIPGTHPVQVVAQRTIGDSQSEDGYVEWIAPQRYAHAQTSGLSVTISEPTDSLVIELSSQPQ